MPSAGHGGKVVVWANLEGAHDELQDDSATRVSGRTYRHHHDGHYGMEPHPSVDTIDPSPPDHSDPLELPNPWVDKHRRRRSRHAPIEERCHERVR